MAKKSNKANHNDQNERVSSSTVAKIVGCTDRNVRKTWNNAGSNDKKTPLTKNIEEVTEFMNQGYNKLVREAKKRVKF